MTLVYIASVGVGGSSADMMAVLLTMMSHLCYFLNHEIREAPLFYDVEKYWKENTHMN